MFAFALVAACLGGGPAGAGAGAGGASAGGAAGVADERHGDENGCAIGYGGVLCAGCDPGWGHVGAFFCVRCPDPITNLVFAPLSVVFFFMTMGMSIFSAEQVQY